MILAAEAVGIKHHSAYHRLFATARWSLDELGLAVFALILPLLNDNSILLGIDDTLARKRGLKIFGVGMHHDPLLSTRKTAIMNWGHCWIVLGVITKLPFCGDRFFCLPVLFRLYVSKKTTEKKKLVYYTKPELAVQMLQLLCGQFEHRRFHAVGDSAYGGKSVLLNLPGQLRSHQPVDDGRPAVRYAGAAQEPQRRTPAQAWDTSAHTRADAHRSLPASDAGHLRTQGQEPRE